MGTIKKGTENKTEKKTLCHSHAEYGVPFQSPLLKNGVVESTENDNKLAKGYGTAVIPGEIKLGMTSVRKEGS